MGFSVGNIVKKVKKVATVKNLSYAFPVAALTTNSGYKNLTKKAAPALSVVNSSPVAKAGLNYATAGATASLGSGADSAFGSTGGGLLESYFSNLTAPPPPDYVHALTSPAPAAPAPEFQYETASMPSWLMPVGIVAVVGLGAFLVIGRMK